MATSNRAGNTNSRKSLRTIISAFLGICIIILAINSALERNSLKNINVTNQETILEGKDFYRINKSADNAAKRVEVGIYIDSLLDLDLKNSTFKATGWMWYSWLDKCEDEDCEKNYDPYGKFDLNYVSDDANKQATPFKAPISWLETGKKIGTMWNEINFGGSFYTSLDLKKFPFDTQSLQIRITSPEFEADEVRYIFDEFAAPISQILIPGYKVVGTKSRETVREYASKFGFAGDSSNTRQSQLIAELLITRNVTASIFRYFFPIIVVLTVTLLTTRLEPGYWEIKLASPATAILSLLFLQDGFRNDLPPTSYLSVLDFYFVVSYLILLLCLFDACQEVGWGRGRSQSKQTRSTSTTKPDSMASKINAISVVNLPEKLALIFFATSPALTYAYFIIS